MEMKTQTPLYDADYVLKCVKKAIETFPEDFSSAAFPENAYYYLREEGDAVSIVGPACIVGQILEHIGVNDEMMREIAHRHNSIDIRQLAQLYFLPITDDALAFLCVVQELNDAWVPWHEVIGQVDHDSVISSCECCQIVT